MLVVIGDVHGKINEYTKIIDSDVVNHSVQIGDMGFNEQYEDLDTFFSLPWTAKEEDHRFIPGNHDEYPLLPSSAYKNPFGYESLGGVDFFYVRGAYSIDKQHRISGVSWWEEEEISYAEGSHAINNFESIKPSIMLTHDCPISVTAELGYDPLKTRTGVLLETMLEAHQPDLWVFGHYHQKFDKIVKGTRFICLEELGVHVIKS